MKPGAWPWIGLVLMVAGPAVPALWPGSPRTSVLVHGGLSAGAPRLTAAAMVNAAPQGLSARVAGPAVVEFSTPGTQEGPLSEHASTLHVEASPAATCDPAADPACPALLLARLPAFNMGSGALDMPATSTAGAPRALWLLGMGVLMLGLALVVRGVARAPGLQRLRNIHVAGAVLLATAVGAGAGLGTSGAVTRTLVVRLAQRPRMPDEPLTRDRFEAVHDMVARLQSPGFRSPLELEVQATPLGPAVLVLLRAPNLGTLNAYTTRVRERVLAREMTTWRETDDGLARIVAAGGPLSTHAQRMKDELVEPALLERDTATDSRTPLVTGGASGAAAFLVTWAARRWTRARRA